MPQNDQPEPVVDPAHFVRGGEDKTSSAIPPMPTDFADWLSEGPSAAAWRARASRDGNALHEAFLSRKDVLRPDQADDTPLSWRADRIMVYAGALNNHALPPEGRWGEMWRGSADDALSVLATGESLCRELLAGRGQRIHQALTLGATWTEVGEALACTPDEARAVLRAYAEENPDLYHAADQRTPVPGLIALGDDERIAENAEVPE